MDKISNTKDLYHFFLDQNHKVNTNQLMSLYMLAMQKFTEEDKYTLIINLNYVYLNPDSSKNLFTTMKMKYYKFLLFWKEYISFEIKNKTKSISKILKTNIKYISLTEFTGKDKIINFLKEVEGSEDLSKFVRRERGFIKVEECDDKNEEGFSMEFVHKSINKVEHKCINLVDNKSMNSDVHKGTIGHKNTMEHKSTMDHHHNLDLRNPPIEDKNILIQNKENNSNTKLPYSPYPKKKPVSSNFPLNTPITPSSSSLAWTKPKFLCNLNLNGLERASPDRKLKFSSYQSPDKKNKNIEINEDMDTITIKNIIDNAKEHSHNKGVNNQNKDFNTIPPLPLLFLSPLPLLYLQYI
ncbi:MPS1-like THR/TYR DUAL specificity protein kinase [Nosema bombycis CQ1]|uniref:MPS1-like THR/TYR DUAL specificity protein kinase n=1 Tax=Nosema bombycis (strain CQ1 / CVCC 102059) TaxID=578461 RepID=R0MBW5_NOSB1|nr:MPS1-like THR/TYR DUAL specificity protein kinase [Nosema bombycis CQ1]|eukprot:EOB15439.1 MPS1-like THR/TYR DUAL specificity protein kinase [Nosema bombycis CQ1]